MLTVLHVYLFYEASIILTVTKLCTLKMLNGYFGGLEDVGGGQ